MSTMFSHRHRPFRRTSWLIPVLYASLLLSGCRGNASPTPVVIPPTNTPYVIIVTATPIPGTATPIPPTAASPNPSETPTTMPAVPTIQPTQAATPGQVSGTPIVFGPFHLPTTDFGPPYTGAFATLDPQTAKSTLDAARAAGMHLLINLAGSRRSFQSGDGSFSVSLFEQRLDAFKGIDFGSYVADGTLVGHMLFDEPQDPSNWNGSPVPYADIEAVAEYSKQLWPTLPVGAGGPPSYLLPGAPYKALDFGFAQYTTQRGDVKTWLQQEVTDARQIHIGLVVSINILGGNNRNSVTATQLQEWGQVLASEPTICGLLMWRYDPSYLQNPTIQQALTAIGQVVKTHPNTPCRP
jgi:hypothetical protein